MLDAVETWIGWLDRIIDRLGNFGSTSATTVNRQKHARKSLWHRIWSWIWATDSWTFYIPYDAGWTGAEIEAILREKGIEISGRGIANNDIFFNVKKEQAEWAEYLMLKAGIPLEYGLYSTRNRHRFPKAAE
ncbi:MAG: hypothetical protein J7M34_15030 [Anaerolineae bacterium]|nr:hypothetical protein [Anaerolineae bacterium]